jgi:hypothetical protein
MDERLELHAQRDLLEFRLVMLEKAIEEQPGRDTPNLAEHMEALFARLLLVNAKLAEMRAMH